ncbi:hypothetical protein PIB30_090163 [Stylosanthes scabra]|uniref:Pentatricopeptide repeat-containing protein n=1 Tax=Stylosanthes scabra TaxID=79078 RepID=A0ABU6ZT13_9FABA|nr:hypothetical protein [Stylosanthes scabra]
MGEKDPKPDPTCYEVVIKGLCSNGLLDKSRESLDEVMRWASVGGDRPLVKGTSSGSCGALYVVFILKLIAQGTFPSGRWSFIPISKEEGKVVVFGESCFKNQEEEREVGVKRDGREGEGKDDSAGKMEGDPSPRRHEEKERDEVKDRERDEERKRRGGEEGRGSSRRRRHYSELLPPSKLPLSAPCLVTVPSPSRRGCWRTEKERRRRTGRGGRRVASVVIELSAAVVARNHRA